MSVTSSGSRLRCYRSRPLARVLLTGLRVEGRFVVYSELACTFMLSDWFKNLVRTCCLLWYATEKAGFSDWWSTTEKVPGALISRQKYFSRARRRQCSTAQTSHCKTSLLIKYFLRFTVDKLYNYLSNTILRSHQLNVFN